MEGINEKIDDFLWNHFDGRQNISSDKIFGNKPKFRQFCLPNLIFRYSISTDYIFSEYLHSGIPVISGQCCTYFVSF